MFVLREEQGIKDFLRTAFPVTPFVFFTIIDEFLDEPCNLIIGSYVDVSSFPLLWEAKTKKENRELSSNHTIDP